MSDSFRFDPDAPDTRDARKKHRRTRDARKADYMTPAPVTRATRDESSRSVGSVTRHSE